MPGMVNLALAPTARRIAKEALGHGGMPQACQSTYLTLTGAQAMAVREQLRGLLRQVVVHPRLVVSAGLANGEP